MKKIDARFMSLSEEIIFKFQCWVHRRLYPASESTVRISYHTTIPIRSFLNMRKRHAVIDAFIGSFQPFASVLHDISVSFQGYRSTREIRLGLWQPIRGILNLIKASIQIIMIAVRFLLSPLLALRARFSYRFVDHLHNPHLSDEKLSVKSYLKRLGIIWGDSGLNLIHTLGLVVRGSLQIVATPLIPVRMLIRGFQTRRNHGYRDFSMNEETIRFVEHYDLLYSKLPANTQYLEITPDTGCASSKTNMKTSPINDHIHTIGRHNYTNSCTDSDTHDLSDINRPEQTDNSVSQTITDIGTTVWLLHLEFIKWQVRGQSLAHRNARFEQRFFDAAATPQKCSNEKSPTEKSPTKTGSLYPDIKSVQNSINNIHLYHSPQRSERCEKQMKPKNPIIPLEDINSFMNIFRVS